MPYTDRRIGSATFLSFTKLSFVILFFLLSVGLQAGEGDHQTNLDEMSESLSRIHSFTFSFKDTKHGPKYEKSLLVKLTQNDYYVETITPGEGGMTTFATFRQNGKFGRYLSSARQMQLRSKVFDHPGIYWFFTPLSIFDFVYTEKPERPFDIGSLPKKIIDSKERILKSSSLNYLEKYKNKKILVFQNCYDKNLDEPSFAVVHFSSNVFPDQVDYYRDEKTLTKTVKVLTWKEVGKDQFKFKIPTSLEVTRFVYKGKFVVLFPKLWKGDTKVFFFTSIEVNQSDEVDFLIDLSLADTIHDLDSDKLITIPR